MKEALAEMENSIKGKFFTEFITLLGVIPN